MRFNVYAKISQIRCPRGIDRGKIFQDPDDKRNFLERMGDGDFVKSVLKTAEQQIKRRYAIQAKGVSLESMAERVSEIFDMPSPELWKQGKRRCQVQAKSVLCYWANRELAVSMSELSRRMKVSVMAISNAVQRGSKIVKELNLSFF